MATKEKTKKREKARFASVYYKDQIAQLDELALELTESTGRSVSRADLLREGADYILSKYGKAEKGNG